MLITFSYLREKGDNKRFMIILLTWWSLVIPLSTDGLYSDLCNFSHNVFHTEIKCLLTSS